MSDSIFFDLRLRDFFSPALPKVAAAGRDVFTGLDKNIMNTQRNLDSLGKQMKVSVDYSGIQQAGREIDRVNAKMGLLGQSSAMFLGGMAERGLEKALGFGKEQISSVITAGMEGSAEKMQFQVLAGKKEGTQLYGDLTKFIQESVFGNELYKDARTMEAFGVATKDVMPSIKMLGDVSMGNADRMAALSLAFAQTTSAGKLMGQDLLQYVNAGFNPLQEIATHTHRKLGDLRDDMSEGKISADMVRQAFVWATSEGGKFHDMLNEMAKTPYGKWEATKGNIDNARLQFGTALLPEVDNFMNALKPVVDDLPKHLLEMKPAIDSMIQGMAYMVTWTNYNIENLGRWFRMIKTGAEAYAAWKVGTTALTAANWLWNASIGVTAMQAAGLTTAIAAENTQLVEQEALVSGLTTSWAMMGVEQRAALMAQNELLMAGNFALGEGAGIRAAASGVSAGTGALAAGFGSVIGTISTAAITLGVGYFTGELVADYLGAGQRGSFFQNSMGYDPVTLAPVKWWDVMGKNNTRLRRTQLNRAGYSNEEADQYMMSGDNPKASPFGVDMDYLNSMGLDAGTGSRDIAAKYGMDKKMNTPATQDASDSIVGGGSKVINITIDKIVETMTVAGSNAREQGENWEKNIKEIIYRIFAGLPA